MASIKLTEDQLKEAGISITASEPAAGISAQEVQADTTRPGSGTIEDPYIDDLWFKDKQDKVHKVQSGNSITLQPFEGEVFEG